MSKKVLTIEVEVAAISGVQAEAIEYQLMKRGIGDKDGYPFYRVDSAKVIKEETWST